MLKNPASIQRWKQVSLFTIKMCSTQNSGFDPLLHYSEVRYNQAVLDTMFSNTLFIDLASVINMLFTKIVVKYTFKVDQTLKTLSFKQTNLSPSYWFADQRMASWIRWSCKAHQRLCLSPPSTLHQTSVSVKNTLNLKYSSRHYTLNFDTAVITVSW